MNQENYTLNTFSDLLKYAETLKQQVEIKSKLQPENKVVQKAMVEILEIVCLKMRREDLLNFLLENHRDLLSSVNDPQSSNRQTEKTEDGIGNEVALQQIMEKFNDQMMLFQILQMQFQDCRKAQDKGNEVIINELAVRMKSIEDICSKLQTEMIKAISGNDLADQQTLISQQSEPNMPLRLDKQYSKSQQEYPQSDFQKQQSLHNKNNNQHQIQNKKPKVQMLDSSEERKSTNSMKNNTKPEQEGWNIEIGLINSKANSSKQMKSGVLEDIIGKGSMVPAVISVEQGSIVSTLIPLNNGGYMVGGKDQELIAFNKDNQQIDRVPMQKGLSAGQTIKDYLVCCLRRKGIQVFNPNTFQPQQFVQTNGSVKKIMKLDESHMILGEKGCYLEILNFFKQKLVYHSYQVDFGEVIWDVQKTTEKDEYVVACGSNTKDEESGALVFVRLERIDGKKFKFDYDPIKDVFFVQSNCVGVVQISKNTFYICIQGKDKIRVFDRKNKKNTKCINNISGSKYYNSIQKALKYDPENFPYVFVKDDRCVSFINTKTSEMKIICNSMFEVGGKNQSLMQIQRGRDLQLITVDYDAKKNIRTLKQIIFPNVIS